MLSSFYLINKKINEINKIKEETKKLAIYLLIYAIIKRIKTKDKDSAKETKIIFKSRDPPNNPIEY
jgi:hypothetical protein